MGLNPDVVRARACINCAFMVLDMPSFGSRCVKELNPSLQSHPFTYQSRIGVENPAALHPIDQMAQFCDHYTWGPNSHPNLRKEVLRRYNTEHRVKDASRLALKFDQWYRPGTPHVMRPKLKVQYNPSMMQYGTVAMSGGERPMLLLMRQVNSRGSWVTLTDDTPVIAIASPRAGGTGKRSHWPYAKFYDGPR